MRRALLGLLLLGCNTTEPTSASLGSTRAPAPRAEARSPAEVRTVGNHLVGEPSPYLLQHAHNPVDWYPWGEEALAEARRSGRPIFLSIGYATCHWCHVMEEESFEDDEVAAFLNARFVAIKVDREQRPDIDALYLEAVGRLGGSTGWPLTVFLTPDLVPFFGGTYFPRHGSGGRPGFLDVLREVDRRFREEPAAALAAQGRQAIRAIEADARRLGGVQGPVEPSRVAAAMDRLDGSRDPELGGFGRRQKFPNAPLLLAELRYARRTGDAAARSHVILTLDQMLRGGVRDHLAGTFHRYAVDRAWHVPHFEKTLYDNAQLAQVYVEAGRWLEEPRFVEVGRAILDDLIDGWQRPDGGMVVGFDADDPAGEGRYYTWTPRELQAALGEEDGARFAVLFGVSEGGEPLLDGRSVLHRVSDARARETLGLDPAGARASLARARGPLLAARSRRAAPAVDDKELAAWNGLALMSLATVGRWLDEPRYVAAAQRVARFLIERCWDGARMLRGRRRGESLGEGFLDDYALSALGLVRLHAADGDPRWLAAARAITDAMVTRLHDPALNAFVHTDADGPGGLPLRRPDLDDGVLPSGGSAAILAALEVGAIAGDRALYQRGERAARAASARAVNEPFASGFLLVALDHLVSNPREVVLVGDDDQTLFAEVRSRSEGRVLTVRLGADGAPDALRAGFAALRDKVAIDGHATAYVCELGRCELPTSDPATLRRQLDAPRP